MKKQLLFLTAIFLFSLATYSQVLISEDFNGATIPTGWLTGANSGSQVWTFGSGVVPGGIADFTTNAAIYNDDAAGDTGDNNDAYLRTEGYMDLSGYDNTLYDLQLKYDYAFNNYYGEKLLVRIYHNYAWYSIIEYTVDTDPTTEVLNISDYFVNDFILAFKYDDIDSEWGYGAGIDNVELKVIPKNDSCINAFNVSALPYTQSLNAEGATNNDGFILYDGVGMNDGVWYSFVGNGGEYEINVDPTGWDPEVAVLTGSCGSMAKIAKADNGGTGVNETVTFTSVVGTTYYVNVGYYSDSTDGAEGAFDIQIQNINLPVNDECSNATNLTVGNIMATHTVGTLAGSTNTGTSYNYPQVWYTATIPASGNLTIETFQAAASDFDDTYIRAFSGTCGSLSVIGADNDSGTNDFSKLELTGRTPGEVIYFVVEKNNQTEPSDAFEILAYEVPPTNDACADAILISNFPFSETNVNGVGATNNDGFIAWGGQNEMNDGVWYKLIGDGADYQIDIHGIDWDPELAVLTGTCGTFTLVDFSDDDLGSDEFEETVSFTSVIGTTYYINIGYYSNNIDQPEGLYDISVTQTCATTIVTNQSPANMEACSGEDVTLSVTATGTNLFYDWLKNTDFISGENSPNLVLTNVQVGTDNYSYLITNACDEETAPTGGMTELIVHPTTVITLQPQDISANTGDDVSFSVAADGGNLTYMWYKDGAGITGATDATYAINDLQVSDAGNYLVAVTGYCGSVSSNNASLDVVNFVSTLDANNFSIYPNPANDFLKVSSELNIETISIFDISGKELININTNSNNTEVNISNLKSGIYFIRIANKDGVFQSKFVKN